jgi:hypothetical protein
VYLGVRFPAGVTAFRDNGDVASLIDDPANWWPLLRSPSRAGRSARLVAFRN